jgi:hypothetical protein
MTDLVYGPTAAGDVRYKNQSYPTGTTSRGALYTTLNSTQQAAVKAMVQAWAATQTADLADNLLNAYLADTALASTYVAYAPGLGGRADFSSYPNASALPGSTGNSYLRIDGPRVWIEFLVQSNGSTAGRVHYRSVWRDKQADYGGRF